MTGKLASQSTTQHSSESVSTNTSPGMSSVREVLLYSRTYDMNQGERDRRYGYPLPRPEARMSAKTTFQTKATQLL